MIGHGIPINMGLNCVRIRWFRLHSIIIYTVYLPFDVVSWDCFIFQLYIFRISMLNVGWQTHMSAAACMCRGRVNQSANQKMEIRINLEHEYCDINADLLFLQITTKKMVKAQKFIAQFCINIRVRCFSVKIFLFWLQITGTAFKS